MKPNLILGLLWQIIKIGSLQSVTLSSHPELIQIGDEDLANLPPEQLLLRWANYTLRNQNVGEIINLGTDIADSVKYIHLMHELNPTICSLQILEESNLLERARQMLKCAEDMGCYLILTAEDIINVCR